MKTNDRPPRFNTVIDPESIEKVKQLVLIAKNIVVTCHVSPDGDALGSSIALGMVLRNLGKNAIVVTADCPPKSLHFLPGAKEIVTLTRHEAQAKLLVGDADLIFCLDFNDLKRIDRLAPLIEASDARRVVIDHHLAPVIDADVVISHPEVSSTSALLYIFLWQAFWARYVNRSSAACIYTGMMTDTGNFSYNSNDPDLYLIVYDLMRKGIDKDRLYKLVMDTSTETSLRIMGYAQYRMQILPEHRVALITLSGEDLKEFDYSKGDTEGLVNRPLSIPEVTWSVYMRQDAPDLVKVSMRSKGDFSVSRICEECFDGGGHANAAGGEFKGTLRDAVSRLLEILPLYDKYL